MISREKKTMDGNQAAAHVAYAYSEVAAIYPITPSSTMAEYVDEWSANGLKNIFGQNVQVTEMQSEAGAAGAVHGSLAAGALTSTFTASQGLLLMLPNLYKIAGELLPGVFHVASRTIASHALSIFGDHSDIYACRQSGVAILALSSVQEVMDLSPVAHLSALKGKLPFINFFEGFRTSHEMQKIQVWDYKHLADMADMDIIQDFREHALNPHHAYLMGSAQNPDVFFQAREACNIYYDALPDIVASYMDTINSLLGTNYQLYEYFGSPNADHIIIAMGSVCETIAETIDILSKQGVTVGVIKVHLYRPFSRKHFLSVIPDTVKTITVLDRTKEPGSIGEPLYLDVVAVLVGSKFHNAHLLRGRYGLSSKNTTPSQILAVYHNRNVTPFTIGITDDVTHLSLKDIKMIDVTTSAYATFAQNTLQKPSVNAMATQSMTPESIRCKFWGLGGDGTVSANKNSIKIIGKHTEKYVQAYFDYDSKKSGGLTISHLRISNVPIRSSYLVEQADFVACHNPVYLHKYNMVEDLRPGGSFLLNCYYTPTEIEEFIPGQVKQYLAKNKIQFYIIDAIKIGTEIGLNNKISTILQAAFFSISNILPIEDVISYMKEAVNISYGKKGDKIVQMNYQAIEKGFQEIIAFPIPEHWLTAQESKFDTTTLQDATDTTTFVNQIQKPITSLCGNDLPVSAFLHYVNGATPSGSSAHERRNVATHVPLWISENCIQCNHCSFVCPHAVIRPGILNSSQLVKAPVDLPYLPMTGLTELNFTIVVSEVDCTGCGACVSVCPGKSGKKALEMCAVHAKKEHQEYFDYVKSLVEVPTVFEKYKINTVKGSQFKKPYYEFSGACAGCGETAYEKLITQLFGTRMFIANATGCTSICSHSFPSTSYAKNRNGEGPAWSNSLFEDAAEFGYGMLLAHETVRSRLRENIQEILTLIDDIKRIEKTTNITLSDNFKQDANSPLFSTLKETASTWLQTYESSIDNLQASEHLILHIQNILEGLDRTKNWENSSFQDFKTNCLKILNEKDFLSKKSHWIFGGDGWAYDIGFGGLDHILASGKNINILVLDTEVYSNTGGQASKSTPTGATAKFAADGKQSQKKDLASIAMTYKNVYVAQIALGADFNQTVKAITEAEQYQGPSLLIAYAPCISHGIRAGMGSSTQEQDKSVKSGYFHLFRYNPDRRNNSLNPFTLDSKEPTLSYGEFLSGENRYEYLKRTQPEKAEALFHQASIHAKERYTYLQRLANLYS